MDQGAAEDAEDVVIDDVKDGEGVVDADFCGAMVVFNQSLKLVGMLEEIVNSDSGLTMGPMDVTGTKSDGWPVSTVEMAGICIADDAFTEDEISAEDTASTGNGMTSHADIIFSVKVLY